MAETLEHQVLSGHWHFDGLGRPEILALARDVDAAIARADIKLHEYFGYLDSLRATPIEKRGPACLIHTDNKPIDGAYNPTRGG